MRVVLFGNSGWCIYNYRRNLVTGLKEQGHEIITVSPYDVYVEKLRELGARHYTINMKPKNLNPFGELLSIWEIYRLLRSLAPDYLFSFTIKCNVYAGICRRFLGFQQIANISGLGQTFDNPGILNRLICFLYKFSLRGAQSIFFQNAEDLEFCVSRGLVLAENCKRIPGSGVDLQRFAPVVSSTSRPTRTFLMFGRLIPKKGYDSFLLAAEDLVKEFPGRAEFWILGIEDKNNIESRDLLHRVQAAAQRDVVRYIPPTDDVLPYVQQADVVALPSQYNEGVPRSLLEALACGKVIITTDWKGCRETVENGINGCLIPVGDPKALYRAMKKIIEMPKDELSAMGKGSRALAEKKFDEQLVISSYLNELQMSAL